MGRRSKTEDGSLPITRKVTVVMVGVSREKVGVAATLHGGLVVDVETTTHRYHLLLDVESAASLGKALTVGARFSREVFAVMANVIGEGNLPVA